MVFTILRVVHIAEKSQLSRNWSDQLRQQPLKLFKHCCIPDFSLISRSSCKHSRMIKLDRRRRRKQKNEEEEEEERTEVGFQQDLIADKLEASENRPGGLQIRRKSSSASVEDDLGTRKGPAMPPPEVLAALAKQEVTVPEPEDEKKLTEDDKTEDTSEDSSETTDKIVEEKPENKKVEEKPIDDQKIEKSEKPKTEDNFKAPSLPGMKPPEPKPPTAPSCDQKLNLPSEIYKAPKIPEQKAPPKAPKEIPKFAYREPDWSDVCENTEYNLEVLKGGKIIGKYDLSGKSCHVLGKLDTCDLKLEHPRKWFCQMPQKHLISNVVQIVISIS